MVDKCKFSKGDCVKIGKDIRGVVVDVVSVDFKNASLPRWKWVIDVKYSYFFSVRDGRDISNEFSQIMTHLESDLEFDVESNRVRKLDELGL